MGDEGMRTDRWIWTGACAVALAAGVFTTMNAQQGGRGGAGANVFTAVDANKDGFVTKDELRSVMTKWVGGGATQEQLATAITASFPAPPPAPARTEQPRT